MKKIVFIISFLAIAPATHAMYYVRYPGCLKDLRYKLNKTNNVQQQPQSAAQANAPAQQAPAIPSTIEVASKQARNKKAQPTKKQESTNSLACPHCSRICKSTAGKAKHVLACAPIDPSPWHAALKIRPIIGAAKQKRRQALSPVLLEAVSKAKTEAAMERNKQLLESPQIDG